MPVVQGDIAWTLGIVLSTVALVLLGLKLFARRWKANVAVAANDTDYARTLATLSEGSVRRHFNPYIDIDWNSPKFAVTQNDTRWVLPATDPIGRHPWYQAQPLDKKIAIGMWRHANLAKIALHFESILISGLMQYTFWLPNGSPEYRYCLHEAVEEGNHSMMFQEMVNRIGVDVPGMPRWLRWLSPLIQLYASLLPNTFFVGVLAGEVPFDHMQKSVLREPGAVHPIVEAVFAIHVAEEARHISFAHEYLRRRVPLMGRLSRFCFSLYVPIIMRMLCQAIVVPTRSSIKQLGMPRSVRKELFFSAPDSRQALRDIFGDVRMLCHELGLMNPLALLMWRIHKIDGRPSRYRGEPQRGSMPTAAAS